MESSTRPPPYADAPNGGRTLDEQDHARAVAAVDFDSIDEETRHMELRFRVLFSFACAVLDGDFPHEPRRDLAGGIEVLYGDWLEYRVSLASALGVKEVG